jgi:hypothetical protein
MRIILFVLFLAILFLSNRAVYNKAYDTGWANGFDKGIASGYEKAGVYNPEADPRCDTPIITLGKPVNVVLIDYPGNKYESASPEQIEEARKFIWDTYNKPKVYLPGDTMVIEAGKYANISFTAPSQKN